MSTPSPDSSAKRLRRVQALFDRALEQPRDQHEAMVRREADDAAMAEEVLALLAQQSAPTDGLRDAGAHATPADGEPRDRVQSTATGELLKKLATTPKLDQQRFGMESEVGKGGMGAIVRIHDRFLNRRLAMKVLIERAEPRDDEERRLASQLLGRFLEEAQVTSQLDHPGVVPVHELGLDQNGKVFFTMRLVKGRTASEVFADAFEERSDWNLTRALEVVLKVCDTMAYAHDKGVLHRDLKPSNVMVGRFGEVYVMDWGLAKVLGQEDRHDLRIKKDASTGVSRIDSTRKRDAESDTASSVVTMDGHALGTPSYMAPEQARGEELDARTDVYAIGAMLYELVTGRAPYTVPGVPQHAYYILKEVVDGPPKRVEEVQQGVPAELVAIVGKAMRRELSGRYASVMELADDVRSFVANRVVKAYRTGALIEMRLWMRRNKALAGTVVSAAMLMLAATIAIVLEYQRAEHLRAVAQEGVISLEHAVKRSDARRIVAHSLDQSHTDPGLGTLLGLLAHDRGEPDAVGAIRRNLQSLHERTRVTWTAGPVLDATVDASRRILISTAAGEVMARPVSGGELTVAFRVGTAKWATFSQRGEYLLVEDGTGTAAMFDTTAGRILWQQQVGDAKLQFSGDGRWLVGRPQGERWNEARRPLVLTSDTGTRVPFPDDVMCTDVAASGTTAVLYIGREAQVFSLPEARHVRSIADEMHDTTLALSPSGNRLLLASDRQAEVVDLTNDDARKELKVFRYSHGTFLEEDVIVTQSTATGTSYMVPHAIVHDAESGDTRFQLTEHDPGFGNLHAITTDGDLAIAGEDHLVRLLDYQGRERTQLRGHAHRILEAGQAPGTKELWSRDVSGTVIVWHTDSLACGTLDAPFLGTPHISPDGRWLAVTQGEWGRALHLRDLETGGVSLTIRMQQLQPFGIADIPELMWSGVSELLAFDDDGHEVAISLPEGNLTARPDWAPIADEVIGKSEDGRLGITSAGRAIAVVERRTGKLLYEVSTPAVGTCRLSSDHTHLLIKHEATLSVWSLANNRLLGRLAMEPDHDLLGAWGSTCVILGKEGPRDERTDFETREVLMWEASSGSASPLGRVPVNEYQCHVIDGVAILAAGRDVRAFDLTSRTWVGEWTTSPGRTATSMDDKTDWVWTADVNRAAGVIAVANYSRVHIWPTDPVAAARSRLVRLLTLEELRRFELAPSDLLELAERLVQDGGSPATATADLKAAGAPRALVGAVLQALRTQPR